MIFKNFQKCQKKSEKNSISLQKSRLTSKIFVEGVFSLQLLVDFYFLFAKSCGEECLCCLEECGDDCQPPVLTKTLI